MISNSSQTPSHWETIADKQIGSIKIAKIFERHAKHPDGREGKFFVLKCADWVQTLALTPNKELVLVKQFRMGSQSLSLETPGGLLDSGETPIEGALRELREETGFVGKTPSIIGSCYPNPALQDNRVHYVLLHACERLVSTSWDIHEELETLIVGLDDLPKLIDEGFIEHSITLTGLLFLNRYLCQTNDNQKD